MKNEWALITGTTGKLGRHISVYLAKKGFNQIILYNSNSLILNELKVELSRYNIEFKILCADFINLRESLRKLKELAIQFKPSLIINSASVFDRIEFKNISSQNLINSMNLNLLTPIMITKILNGIVDFYQIINILDSRAKQSSSPYASYLLSKKQLEWFTYNLDQKKIRINGIAPQIIKIPGEKLSNLERKIAKQNNKTSSLTNFLDALEFLISNKKINREVIRI